MKAIIKYDLSDPDDRVDHMIAVHANDMCSVLWEFLFNSKKEFEWKIDDKNMTADETLDMIYEKLADLLNEHSLDIDKLMQ